MANLAYLHTPFSIEDSLLLSDWLQSFGVGRGDGRDSRVSPTKKTGNSENHLAHLKTSSNTSHPRKELDSPLSAMVSAPQPEVPAQATSDVNSQCE